jgi:hypothetical protein
VSDDAQENVPKAAPGYRTGGRAPLAALCVMGDCHRSRTHCVTVRFGGEDRHVEVCDVHRAQLAPLRIVQ